MLPMPGQPQTVFRLDISRTGQIFMPDEIFIIRLSSSNHFNVVNVDTRCNVWQTNCSSRTG